MKDMSFHIPPSRSTKERTPTDGKPFYCKLCGAGLQEYYGCEMPDCELEDEKEATSRAALSRQEAQG